ncbi:MAG TPA: sulfatase [Bryobacteraceae bacterium]|jgi:arylsulfatase A-like enzyme
MRLLLFALVTALSAASLEAAQPKPQFPNVLLITVDTLRADHLSCYGYARRTSPYLDELAREGTRFERAYTVIPLTGPAHLALMTSRYPQENGVRRNGEALLSDRALVTLPQILRSHGYQTAGFVSSWPLLGRLTHLNDYFEHYDETLTRTYQLFNSSRYAEDVTPLALKWLRKHAGHKKPFFLWVHYFDPHSPYISRTGFNPPNVDPAHPFIPSNDGDMRQRARDYDSEIYYTDHYIGKLLSALDDMHVRDSTLVVVTADHGESLGQHGYVGHGRHLYEGILHIPLIVRFPGHVKAGKVVHTPVSIIDITPTIVDLTVQNVAAAKQKVPVVFSGRSLASVLSDGAPLTNRWIYYVTFPGKKGYAPHWLSWMWVSNEELPSRFGRTDNYSKMIWDPNDEKLYLYDLRKDPHELHGREISENKQTYTADTSQLKKWFLHTETRAQEQKLSAHDVEVLKSLGYVQ